MIKIQDLWKTYRLPGVHKTVAKGLNLTFPDKTSVGLFGRNGAGKSTLLRMIAGTEPFDSGMITSDGTISWPVGFSGSFHGDLTGAQNVRFVGRIYGVDTDELIDFVKEFADLGGHFYAPFRTYSSGMRSRLAFGLSMGIRFDTYLIDEVTSVGDAAFRSRSTTLLHERINQSAAIIVSHSMPLMRDLCTHGVVMIDGVAHWYDDVADAIAHHQDAMKVKKK